MRIGWFNTNRKRSLKQTGEWQLWQPRRFLKIQSLKMLITVLGNFVIKYWQLQLFDVHFARRRMHNGNLWFLILFACSFLDNTECPLTLASQLEGCAELIKVLKSGGAHLDFRTKDGITALHKAVRSKNHTALIVSITHTHTHTHIRKLTHLFYFFCYTNCLFANFPSGKGEFTGRQSLAEGTWAIEYRECLSKYVRLNMPSLNGLAYSLNGLACVWFEEACNLN